MKCFHLIPRYLLTLLSDPPLPALTSGHALHEPRSNVDASSCAIPDVQALCFEFGRLRCITVEAKVLTLSPPLPSPCLASPPPALDRALGCLCVVSCERQAYKPEAVVRAYRAFVESFGGNFAPPPVRGAARRIHLTPEDLAQQKRTQHLSDVRYHCRLCVLGRRLCVSLACVHRTLSRLGWRKIAATASSQNCCCPDVVCRCCLSLKGLRLFCFCIL